MILVNAFEQQDFHRYMCLIHRRSEALRRGSLIPIMMEQDLVCYGRVLGKEKVLVVIYTGAEDRIIDVPVWLLGIQEYDSVRRIMLSSEENYNVGWLEYGVQGGVLSIRATQNYAAVFSTGTL